MTDTQPRLRRRPAPAPDRPVPPVLYVPTTGADGPPQLELRVLPDGRQVVLAYTALDRLLDGLGPEQPWTLMATADLELLDAAHPIDAVLLDQVVPEVERPHAPGQRR